MTKKVVAPASEPTAVLASGGMDSTVLLWWLRHHNVPTTAIFVDYGHAAAIEEGRTLRIAAPPDARVHEVSIAQVYQGLDSPSLRARDLWAEDVTDESLHLPARNLLLLSSGVVAAERLGINRLFAAFITSNITATGDRSIAFLEAMRAVARASSDVIVDYPFLELSKAQVAELGVELGAPIGKTFSCQAAARTPCGACSNCVDRLRALESLQRGVL